ncbi:hypothetical protein HN51_040344, partial [Arachis hypogaea]
LYRSLLRGRTMGRWLKDQKERKKQEIRTQCSVACCSTRGRHSCCRCGHCSFNRVYIVESIECT